MSELGFDWNTKKVKTVTLQNGTNTIVEMTPKQIIAAPNRHRIETLIQSLCIVVNQLMEAEEADANRMYSSLQANPSEERSEL